MVTEKLLGIYFIADSGRNKGIYLLHDVRGSVYGSDGGDVRIDAFVVLQRV